MHRIVVFLIPALLCCAPAQEGRSVRNDALPISAQGKPSADHELVADASGILSQQQIRGIMQEGAEKDIANNKKQRDYTYIEREEEQTLNGKGEVKKTEVRTREIVMVYGEQIERLIAKDDKPLSPKDAEKEEKRIQKIVDKKKNETEEQRQKRLKQEEKDRQDEREFVLDVSDAYIFHLRGIEPVNGRDAYVIDADPRPGFQPRHKDAKFLPKIKGRIWIDVQEHQWVRIDAQVIDTISFGLLLARLHKGTRIMAEQTRVNDEVWLPKHESAKVDVRLALLKNFNVNENVTYSNYQKFRTGSRILGIAPVQP